MSISKNGESDDELQSARLQCGRKRRDIWLHSDGIEKAGGRSRGACASSCGIACARILVRSPESKVTASHRGGRRRLGRRRVAAPRGSVERGRACGSTPARLAENAGGEVLRADIQGEELSKTIINSPQQGELP